MSVGELPYEAHLGNSSGSGKRQGRPLIVAAGSSTGTISIAVQAVFSLSRTTGLVAANGSSIQTFGKRRFAVSFGPSHKAFHTFWIATVKRPNLGADFFSDNEILIDVANTKLILKSGQTLQAQHTRPPLVFGLRLPTEGPFESLLEEFPGLLTQNFRGKVRHKVQLFIPTTGPPIHARPRRLDGEKLKVA